MTLASQGAMAADMVCKSPSAALSNNPTTSHTHPGVACLGRSPDYWKTQTSEWVGIAPTDEFAKYFYTAGTPLGTNADIQSIATVTCLGVLNNPSFDKGTVAMHIMATYLNITSGRISFITEEGLMAMWREYFTTNAYIPTAGATAWNSAEIVLYLSGTQKQGDIAEVAPVFASHSNNGNNINSVANGNNGNHGGGNNGNGNGNNGGGNSGKGNGNVANGNGSNNGNGKGKN